MNALQKMFPSLTLFSDLNWDQVTEEYQRDYGDISFPEYLQQKAIDGDSPPYLFELAFYELAKSETENTEEIPPLKGIHLNPTALFLSLEFDVVLMLKKAQKGEIEIIERPHVLCLFKDSKKKLQTVELEHEELEVLEKFEDGTQHDIQPSQQEVFERLVQKGLIVKASENQNST